MEKKEALNEKDRVLEMVVPALMNAMEETFNEEQKKPHQYVVAYYTTKGDKLLGYHADSFCSLVDEKLQGKRYNGEDTYPQLAIIRKNLDSILNSTTEKPGFGGIPLSVRTKYFNNMTAEDVYIVAEYLEDGIAPQRFAWKSF